MDSCLLRIFLEALDYDLENSECPDGPIRVLFGIGEANWRWFRRNWTPRIYGRGQVDSSYGEALQR